MDMEKGHFYPKARENPGPTSQWIRPKEWESPIARRGLMAINSLVGTCGDLVLPGPHHFPDHQGIWPTVLQD